MIVNPPYTTLTAYDLNNGTIKWEIGLGDDLGLVGQGITGTRTAGTVKGGVIPTAAGLVFAPPITRCTSTTARPANRFLTYRSAPRPAAPRPCTN
jgi:hypothetical protein